MNQMKIQIMRGISECRWKGAGSIKLEQYFTQDEMTTNTCKKLRYDDTRDKEGLN